MSKLKETLKKKIEGWRPRTTKLLKEYGDVKVGEVTIAQVIGGIAFTIFAVIQTSLVDTADVLSSIDPALLDQLVEMGVDIQALENMLGPAGALLSGSFCCVGGLIFAAILGAVGGALYAAIKPD